MPSKYLTDREVCRISGESSFQPDLIDNALATRQRCPKSRESTRNRRYFSHEQPIIIPHANGKNATAPLRTALARHFFKVEDPVDYLKSTIRSERFACAGRSSRRNLWTPSKKPPTASYPDLNHYRELPNCTVRHDGSSGKVSDLEEPTL